MPNPKAELFDDATAACTTIAEEPSHSLRDTRTTMTKHLAQAVPDLSKLLEYERVLDALWSFTEGLAELIRERKNSIWSFIIRNSYRPAMLKGHFDYIVGNPPWLSYRFISDPEYQDEVKRRAIDKYEIAPKSQKLFTQMELATVFLAHSMATFANLHVHLAFVLQRAGLVADHNRNLVLRRSGPETRMRLAGYWDLWDITPLFNVPPCALLPARTTFRGLPKNNLPALKCQGNLPVQNSPSPSPKN